MRNKYQLDSIEFQSYVAMLAVIFVGYFVTFLGAFTSDGYNGTTTETIWSLILGAVYVGLSLKQDDFFEKMNFVWGAIAYFTIQLLLLFAINWLVGPGGIWLVVLPLGATAVERLPLFWQLLVYILMLGTISLPVGIRYDSWDAALGLAISISPAVLFVVVFAKVQIDERAARERAEELTKELEASNRQLAEYATQAEEVATIEERNRLAREIHDNLGHYLTVVNVQIGAAKVLIGQEETEKATEALDKAQNLTQEGLTAVRQSVATLRQSPTENKPLAEAIAPFIAETNNAGILTELTVKGEPRKLDPKIEFTIYRVAQEGLTNVRKHAHASSANLLLDYESEEEVRLEIADNGVGTAVTENGFGLLGIQERINLLNGEVAITTSPQQGFTLQITIPT